MAGTLYTYPESFRAYKAQVAAQYSGAKLEVPEFKLGETNKTQAFLKKFPLGKVPAYESKDGVLLFESNAIAYYLSTDAMRGANKADAAAIQQWISFGDSEIVPASCTWVYPCLGIMQFNKQNTERAKTDIKRALGVLNDFLLTHTYLVGERISLADICLCCNLLALYQMVLDSEFRQSYGNVNRWFITLVNQPQFKAVLGDVKLCEKMAQFDAKKYQELHGQAKPEKKKPEKKAAEKPKEKPKPKPEVDDEPRAEKPSKDPFAALPEGTFVMDDWKKVYSNEDTTTVAVPYFWKNFDKENYSIWYGEYKYPEDLKMIFMSCNLISDDFPPFDLSPYLIKAVGADDVDDEKVVGAGNVDDEKVVGASDMDDEKVVGASDVDDEKVVGAGDMDDEKVVGAGDVDDEKVVGAGDVDDEKVVGAGDVDDEKIVGAGDMDDEKVAGAGGVDEEKVVGAGDVDDEKALGASIGTKSKKLGHRWKMVIDPAWLNTYLWIPAAEAISEHKLNTGHQCSMKDVNILDHEENWHRRKIKEAINIHRKKPTLNRDVGQELPPVLLQLVSHDIGHVTHP
ncbi:Elongation factor 1-gamma [Lamellibrachia satsuma]|nr:Elongation factor 1-gamma [Lamellibrachia satsuma]